MNSRPHIVPFSPPGQMPFRPGLWITFCFGIVWIIAIGVGLAIGYSAPVRDRMSLIVQLVPLSLVLFDGFNMQMKLDRHKLALDTLERIEQVEGAAVARDDRNRVLIVNPVTKLDLASSLMSLALTVAWIVYGIVRLTMH